MSKPTLSYLIAITALFISSLAIASNDIATMKKEAVTTTKAFVTKLGGTMKKEMKAGGPLAAVKVCSEMAPSITAEISRKEGWKVTRVGTRVRNPMLGMPDAWEQQVLAKFSKRASDGEGFGKMAYAEIVEETDGKYFRFMKAIGIKSQCLACHGDEASINPEVKKMLNKRYPHDKATGYKVGDLRGAVSIKRPL